jgi:hypothetical protein
MPAVDRLRPADAPVSQSDIGLSRLASTDQFFSLFFPWRGLLNRSMVVHKRRPALVIRWIDECVNRDTRSRLRLA